MKNAEVAKRAADALGSIQLDAVGLSRIQDMPDRIHAALRILSAGGSTAEVGRLCQRAQRNADLAATLSDDYQLRGISLFAALTDVLFVIAEKAAQPDPP